MTTSNKQLSISSFSLANGLLGAVILALLSIFAMLGKGQEIVQILSSLFTGYDASGAGLFLGLVWGFLSGCIYGLIVSWFYNKML